MNLFFFLVIFPFSVDASIKIHSASNIQDGKIFLELGGATRSAYFFDISSAIAKKIGLPGEIGEEEILGSFFFPGKVVLISQWTKGDGKFPHLWELDQKQLKWTEKKEIPCISFDRIKAKENKLLFFCEDPLMKKIEVEISFKVKKEKEWILPLTQDSEGKYSFRLEGPHFSWGSLKIKSPLKKEKSLQADEIDSKK